MNFSTCAIEGLVLIEATAWEDSRGMFMETYHEERFHAHGITARFVQDNFSVSHQGVLRGLHAQAGPQAQGKLVRVLRGRAFDVAVDIRQGSPTFGQYHAIELSAHNRRSFWIPAGFLHGFLALEDHTIFTYKTTGLYDPSGELGVRWDDPTIGIDWPSEFARSAFIVSDKDRGLPLLHELNSPFIY